MFIDLAQVFNFAFNPFALLSLLAIVVNLSLIILIQVKGTKNEANRWFVLLLVALIIWGVGEFFGRLSTTAEASSFWGYIGVPGWIFISVVFFSFVLTYIGKKSILENRFGRFIIFGPGLVFLFLSWNTNLISNNDISTSIKVPWGWDDLTVAPYFWVFVVWLESFFLISVYLLTRFYFKLRDEVRKKQTLLIIIAVLIPIIGGSLTDAILPIFNIQVVPIAILLTSVMGMIVTYATIRFRLFVISPTLTAKTIVDTMSEALVVISPAHEIEQVNKATLDLLGFKDGELVGKSIRRIIPDVANWEHFLKRVVIPLKERTYVKGCEVDFRTKDGKTIPVSFSATSLVEKGKLMGIVGLSRDIRETRKLINRLTAERNKINVTMNGIVDGVFAVDRKGKIILFNPAMERMLKVGQDQVLGKYSDDVVFMSEKDAKVSIFELLPKKRIYEDQVVAKKKKIKIVERDGGNVYVELTSSTIAESEEIDLGAIITLHDISKEHELEEMKLDFVSMAAHELRTPLTSIRGYLSVLQDELRNKVSKEEMSFLQKAFISSSQLASLVENLLSVSRIERGRMKVEKSSVDWVELVTEVVNNYKDQARQKGLELVFKKRLSKPIAIPIDRFRMGEVLSNLVGNAINYTDPGGKVEVSIEVKDSEVVTNVEDTGQGIPEEALPKLFTKFFRVSGVLEQGSKGTGLGLYISKAIVEMHNGRIWAKSILDEGSTFSFALPVSVSKEEKVMEEGNGNGRKKVGVLDKTASIKRTFVRKGKKIPQMV